MESLENTQLIQKKAGKEENRKKEQMGQIENKRQDSLNWTISKITLKII